MGDDTTARAADRFVRTDHQARVVAVAEQLGVFPHDLARALGAHQLMLVKASRPTVAYLLGFKT